MNKKTVGLFLILFVLLFLIVFLTWKGVRISTPTPEKQYVLEGAKYLGVEDSSCFKTACDGMFKFQSGNNVYQLKGHRHELETLVVDSYYDVYYNNNNKEIKSYDFAKSKE